jgi:hypothetical protein
MSFEQQQQNTFQAGYRGWIEVLWELVKGKVVPVLN